MMFVFGTRPEAIKMAPLIKEFQKYSDIFEVKVCVTGQHREMLDQVLSIFDITPDYDLNIMRSNQDLYDITAKILLGMRNVLFENQPEVVFVHGDTISSTTAALAAFFQKIPVAHVEAGLRTNDIYSPWPEEMNRQITSRLATYHFAPTESAKQNLLIENVKEENILITGNTVIDTLNVVNNLIETDEKLKSTLVNTLIKNGYNLGRLKERKLILITGHRRENFGDGFLEICKAIGTLSDKFPEVDFVYPVHLNPNVQEPVNNILKPTNRSNLFLIEPIEYFPFVLLMKSSYLILTDSGGIQEEAPSLGKPVLVMRNSTERPEAVEAGTVKLVGANAEIIINEVTRLLENKTEYDKMNKAKNPYGDGTASIKIVDYLRKLQSPN